MQMAVMVLDEETGLMRICGEGAERILREIGDRSRRLAERVAVAACRPSVAPAGGQLIAPIDLADFVFGMDMQTMPFWRGEISIETSEDADEHAGC